MSPAETGGRQYRRYGTDVRNDPLPQEIRGDLPGFPPSIDPVFPDSAAKSP